MIDHYPVQCAGCGAALDAKTATDRHQKRQVFGLPEPQPLTVTEHRAHACCCLSCGTVIGATFPDQVIPFCSL
jgi:DNA-directed RNA polymerase subunit N (RpoN/RPB10)